MLRHSTMFLLVVPFLCLGQSEIYPLPTSPDIIWNKCISLSKAGKLDSVRTSIILFENYSNRIDNVKQFYIYVDTVKYRDSSFAIGQIILDPLMEFERKKFGEWSFYYPSGKFYSKGSYSIGAYTECRSIGHFLIGYSFKTGEWKYYYENGVLMAKGIYEPAQVEKKTNCGTDTVNVSNVTSKWTLFDNSGNKLNNGETIDSIINNRH